MKIKPRIHREQGSVLMISLITITIMTLLCATSLYIASQNANSGMQTASWQQSLTGAEAAIDQGIMALNTGSWTNWSTVSGTPPIGIRPSGGSAATGSPDSSHYNYLVPSAIGLQGEGNNSVTGWVTVDTAGLPSDNNGNQWYRVRATGVAGASGPPRVSNNKLDSNLRKLAFRFARYAGGAVATPQASRTVEVIAQANAASIWVRGVLMKDKIQMSGSSYIDSFDSSNPFKSTNGLYDQTKRQSHGDVATVNTDGSDLNSMYVYGNLAYSGSPAVKNTTNVQGTISTPFTATIPTVSDPSWSSGSYSTMNLNSTQTLTVTGTQSNHTLIKTSGDLNLSGSNILTIAPKDNTTTYYVDIWVPGQFQISGSAGIVQQQGVVVKFYVDNQIQMSGATITNGNNTASSLTIIGIGNNQNVQLSGSSAFIGVVEAPGDNLQISGSANYSGAFIGNTLQLSGSASVHYDQALNKNGGSSSVSYSFASWFEDNSDPKRSITY
jgi:hypothetical protein